MLDPKVRSELPNVRTHGWKPGESGNPLGKPKGALGKYTQDHFRRLLHVLGQDDVKVVRKIVEVALKDGHKEQGTCMKLIMERLIPATKAIEISGLGGKELALKVIVEGIKGAVIESQRLEDADRIEDAEIVK